MLIRLLRRAQQFLGPFFILPNVLHAQLRGCQTNSQADEVRTQQKYFAGIFRRDLNDVSSSSRNKFDKPVSLQCSERLPNRRATDFEFLGNLVLSDFLIGSQTVLGDLRLDVIDDPIDKSALLSDIFYPVQP